MKYFKITFICFISLALCSSSAYSQTNDLKVFAKFFDAGSAYKQEDYHKAIALYEEILHNGLESGELYYNLGNSYFKVKKLGKAVLNYERARRLIPRDSDLESNYSFALSMVGNQHVPTKPSFVHRFIHGYSDQFTLNELTVIIFGLLLFMGILYLSCLFLKCSSKVLFSSIIVLSLAFISHAFFLSDKIYYENNYAIALNKTDSKFEPIDGATIHFVLPEGGKAQIIKEKDGWLKIRRPDGKEGWNKKDALEKIQNS